MSLLNPPMIEAIGEDPVLRDTKMIAEAWDAAGLYQVGSFSTDPRWAEWNGRFRDDVRAFMIGSKNTVITTGHPHCRQLGPVSVERPGPLMLD